MDLWGLSVCKFSLHLSVTVTMETTVKYLYLPVRVLAIFVSVWWTEMALNIKLTVVFYFVGSV